MSAGSSAIGVEIPAGFSRLVPLEAGDGASAVGDNQRGRALCGELEIGNLLYLENTPFSIPTEDRELLLGRKQVSSAYHKNIAYRPGEGPGHRTGRIRASRSGTIAAHLAKLFAASE